MKKYLIVMMVLFIASCADENLKPIVTFDDAGHGAYVRLVSETGERNINFFNYAGSTYSYSVDFVDDQKGNGVATYSLDIDYKDVNGVNSTTVTGWKSFAAADFTTSDAGYKAVSDISLDAVELIAAVGLDTTDINQADVFSVIGTLVMNDGAIHTGATSSATVKGAAFQGNFDTNFPVVCPSNLAGTHDVSTVGWCGNTVSGGKTTWISESNGVYSVDADYLTGDYSFGAYDACYGDGATFGSAGFGPQGNLRINDLCNELYWTGASQWGEIYTFNSVSVSGPTLVLDWVNDYGEAGVTTLTREGGADWPPLFIK